MNISSPEMQIAIREMQNRNILANAVELGERVFKNLYGTSLSKPKSVDIKLLLCSTIYNELDIEPIKIDNPVSEQ